MTLVLRLYIFQILGCKDELVKYMIIVSILLTRALRFDCSKVLSFIGLF
jgi:hypothetical protein